MVQRTWEWVATGSASKTIENMKNTYFSREFGSSQQFNLLAVASILTSESSIDIISKELENRNEFRNFDFREKQ